MCSNEAVYNDLSYVGANIISTLFQGSGHDANTWKAAFGIQNLLPWLLSQQLNQPMPAAAPALCYSATPAIGVDGQYTASTTPLALAGTAWKSPNFSAPATLSSMTWTNTLNLAQGNGTVTSPDWAASVSLTTGSNKVALSCAFDNSFYSDRSGTTRVSSRINVVK